MDVSLQTLDIAEQLVSPSSLLFTQKPKPQSRRRASLQKMDKRHPSSFQQLEKARDAEPRHDWGSHANVLSSAKALTRQ